MSLKVYALTCEYRATWLGTDVTRPRFSWKLQAEHQRGVVQAAYRLQVREASGNYQQPLWDTGYAGSDQSIHLEYDGPDLKPRTRYYVRVKVWDQAGHESAWSEETWWETGLMSPEHWQASWITPRADQIDPHDPAVFMLRKSFRLGKTVRSARIYATAAGMYEIHINGQRLGDELFAPGWTSYSHRHQYQAYDASSLLKSGDNSIGVLLGDGWYKGELTWLSKRNIYGDRRALLLQLHVQFEDGDEEVIVTDESWKASTGPILLSELYAGETYDARLELAGWSGTGFDDRGWSAVEILNLPYQQLVAQENWPCRVTERLRPVKVIHTPAGDTVLDMGQNLVGRVRMNLAVSKGMEIELHHAEVLDKHGNFYTGNLRKARQTVRYIAGYDGEIDYAPHFTFQGFRYVRVRGLEGWTDEQLMAAFTAEVIHSDMEPAGSFVCSNEAVNQLYRNVVWGQRGNFVDVPTDCPQRDERLGWTGDAQIFARTAAFNYQVAPFFTKWLRDLKADQWETGAVPFVVPNALGDYTSGQWGDETLTSSAWGDAVTIVPWTMYLHYGDRRLLAEQYGSMKAWVEFIRRQGKDEYLWDTGFQFGDWLALDAHEGSYFGATPVYLVATAFYAHSTRILRDAAAVLGMEDDVREYTRLHAGIVEAFRRTYIREDGSMIARTQTSYIMPLIFDLVEGELRKKIAAGLNDLVVEQDYHLTTGFVGTPYLCLVLSENGYHDTAVKLLLQDTYPSWLYSVSKGATTIWEHWDGIKPDGSFWSDDMNSFNHYAYGAIGDWMFRHLAGLAMDESVPAFAKLRIQPQLPVDGLTYAEASYESMYGNVEVGWRLQDGKTMMKVTVPVNCTAEVIVPGARIEMLWEGDTPIRQVIDSLGSNEDPVRQTAGIKEVEQTASGVRLLIGSGSYSFVSA